MTVELGDKVKDVVTGFDGIAIGMSRWMTGCDQFAVQAGIINADGKLSDSIWFDRNRLTITKKAAVKIDAPEAAKDFGGPMLTH